MDKIDDRRMGDRAELFQVPQFSSWAAADLSNYFSKAFSFTTSIPAMLFCNLPSLACAQSTLIPQTGRCFKSFSWLCVIPERRYEKEWLRLPRQRSPLSH